MKWRICRNNCRGRFIIHHLYKLDTQNSSFRMPSIPTQPEFRLICTAPDLMTNDSMERYKALDLPGFFVPTTSQLRDRATIDRFLSQALDVPLTITAENELVRLQCIDENRFVLTLDFVIKMLNMHERIACRVPCIIEGETGLHNPKKKNSFTDLQYEDLTRILALAGKEDSIDAM